MDKQEALETDYRIQRRNSEEQEDEVLFQRDKGIQMIEELEERAYYYLKDYVPDSEFMTQALHSLYTMKEEIFEAAQHDKKQIEQELEAAEDTYFQAIRKLSAQEATRKESDA